MDAAVKWYNRIIRHKSSGEFGHFEAHVGSVSSVSIIVDGDIAKGE